MSLLEVRDLRISAGDRPIVTGLDFQLEAGEAVGVVGESGSGKSLTMRAINRTLPQGVSATGQISYAGRDLLSMGRREIRRIRGSEIAMIFQDPFTMLNPLMRCGAQITEMVRDECGRRLRGKAQETEARRRLEEVGIEDSTVAGAYPFELSGGMRQRVGIAAALALDPKILIADEPSTALDVITQRDILARIKHLQEARGMGLVLITHDLRVAFSISDRVRVLYAGTQLESASAVELDRRPRHPYTLGLLLAEPPSDRRVSELVGIAGSVPEPADVAGRCVFSPRCRWAGPACNVGRPALIEAGEFGDSHLTACVRHEEIAAEMMQEAEAVLEGVKVGPAARPDGQPVLRVGKLSKQFGGDGSERVTLALSSVDLEVGAGECVGLVGQSGSGKTTLGRCLVGLEQATSGQIEIGGFDAFDRRALSRPDRETLHREIQMVFQDPFSTLNPARTVGATLREALAVGGRGGRATRAAASELLERVGLDATYGERKPVGMSGGERQRVAIARALATNPKVIVCDEAVSALDVSVQAQILNLLLSVHREEGTSLLFITHDLAVVRQVTDRIYVLRKGEVVEEGPTQSVLEEPRHAYTRELLSSVPRSDHDWLSGSAVGR